MEQYMWGISFIPLNVDGQKIFGFSEFMSGLAIMVIAWTLSDTRYKFRIQVAPLPLIGLAFSSLFLIGVLSLMTDLWRAEGWLVPKGDILTPAVWQALLGLIFLMVLFVWAWIAFFRQVDFNKYNAERFVRVLYSYVVKGDVADLAVVGDEMKGAVWSVVRHARDFRVGMASGSSVDGRKVISEGTEKYANEVLMLVADRRFCRAMVAASPGTIACVFGAMLDTKKYGVNVSVFAKNVVEEALLNRDSFLYHESEYWESGLVGRERPICRAIFSDFFMVEKIGSMFDLMIGGKCGYDSSQISALCRAVLMTFRGYVDADTWQHSFVLVRFFHMIPHCLAHSSIPGDARAFVSSDAFDALMVVVKFVSDAISIIGEREIKEEVWCEINGKNSSHTIYDDIARLIFELISNVSYLNSPSWECYDVQRNRVWENFFGPFVKKSKALNVVQRKVRRILYDEIVSMNDMSARILGFCLNVMGVSIVRDNVSCSVRPLHQAVIAWVKENFTRIYSANHDVAESCLIGRITYDSETARIFSNPCFSLLSSAGGKYIELKKDTVQH